MKFRQPTEETINRIFDSIDRVYLNDQIGEASWCNDNECSCHQVANYAQERLEELEKAVATRNFYVDGQVDGRATGLTGGPRNSSGGMRLSVTQRENGGIVQAFYIRSWVMLNGKLITTVSDREGNVIGELTTDR